MKKSLPIPLLLLLLVSLSFIPRTTDIISNRPNFEKDSVFLKAAASSNLMQIVLGNMAQQRTTTAAVKKYAARMVTENTKALADLKVLAKEKHIQLPKVMLRQHSRHETFLRDMSGLQFDKMYTRVMVEEHQEDLNEFEFAAKKAKDADIRTWAESMLPTLQQHLNAAIVLREEVRYQYRDLNVNAIK